MSTCLIISGGELSPISEEIKYDYVIACDSGYNNAVSLGIRPDYVIGDFDSFIGDPETDLAEYPVSRHSIMKDDTDTMLAIKDAIAKGYTDIVIVCALGGRMDHTIANIQSLSYIASKGVSGKLISKTEYITVLSGKCKASFSKVQNRSLSLFSLTDNCEGVSIEGALYELSGATLSNTFPLGYGNEWVKDTITVSLTKGQLLVIMSDKSHELKGH